MKTSQMEMDFAAKRNKMIGIAVSALFHALLLLLFLFMGLSYQIPPPPEYGIEVDMGGGGGGGSSSRAATMPTTPTPSTSGGDITQNIEETVTTNPAPKTVSTTIPTPITTRPEPIPETPTIDQRALFQPKSNTSGTGSGGTGTGSGTGSGSGSGDGEGTGQGSGRGNGIGTSGGDFYLNGRPVISKAFPASKPNLEGVVVVSFKADRDGNVTEATAGGKGTTIQDTQIWKECEKAALKSKFKPKSDAEIVEKGTITYRFVVQ